MQEIIDSAVKKATEELTSKHNGEMASLRTKHSAEIEKVKKEAGLSAEELARQRAEEMAQAQAQELADLRTFKKTTVLKDKLAKAGLPHYFVNDNRLINAEDGELDKVIKTVKSEYEASQPSGTTHSTVVPMGGNGAKPTPTPQSSAYDKMGQAINELLK